MENAVKCHVEAIKDLEELLSTTRSSCAEREESLKKEVDSLKQVVSSLETQMGKFLFYFKQNKFDTSKKCISLYRHSCYKY